MLETTDKGPATPSLAHERQQRAAELCRDVYAGPLHMRDKGQTYLPKFPRETIEAYKDRLNTSVMYDAFSRTADGLTGMVFRQPPKIAEAVPQQVKDLWENIDLAGTHGDVFCRRRHCDGEVDGHFVIFVDMQQFDPSRERTLADSRAAKKRPYWIGLRKQDVLAADYEVVDGVPVLVHFRYRECVTVKDGSYRQKEIERVREYNLTAGTPRTVSYVVHEKKKGDTGVETWTSSQPATMAIDEIPVAVGYIGEKRGAFESAPPHLPLAFENIKHYQLVSDNDNVLHMCAVPQWVVIGAEAEGTAAISANGAWNLPLNGDLKCVGPEGTGLEAMETRIQKSEQRMAILGLSMLMSESRAAETLGSKQIDKAESDSELANHARASQDAFEDGLRLTAKWLGVEMPAKKDNRWLEISGNFDDLQLDPQTIQALAKLVANRDLTQETMWSILLRGKLLPDTFDPAAEKKQLEEEILAEAARIAEQMKDQPPTQKPPAQ